MDSAADHPHNVKIWNSDASSRKSAEIGMGKEERSELVLLKHAYEDADEDASW